MARPIVAVTGATGFIGRNLLESLLLRYEVRALVRPSSFTRTLPPGVERIKGDLFDQGALLRLVDGAYAVVHLAGAIRGAAYEDFSRPNVKGFLNLLEACQERGVKRFLYLSSLAAKNPHLSPYAATKRQAEEFLKEAPLSWHVFRPPAVYGPYDQGLTPLIRLVLKGYLPVFGSLKNRFSLIYVEDLCEAILAWLKNPPPPGRIYELHDGRPGGYSWEEVREIVTRVTGRAPRVFLLPEKILRMAGYGALWAAKCLGKAPLFSPYKVNELCHPDWTCANDEISKDLGWRPRWPLEKVLAEWVRDERGDL